MGKIIFSDALDALKTLPNESVDMCVTSPPYYGLRDYGVVGQIGLEPTPEEYIDRLVAVFREVRRILRSNGTLWIVIADSYAGSGKNRKKDGTLSKCGKKQKTNHGSVSGNLFMKIPLGCKPKDLIGIPWLLAFALRKDGWYLRSDIIWHKPNVMPESVKDRPTKSYEHVFLLAKSRKYYYDNDAVLVPARYDGRKETINKGSSKYEGVVVPGNNPQSQHVAGKPHERWRFKDGKPVKNRRDVWTVNTKPYKGSHFATFPPELIRPCIRAGCPEGVIVLDPFIGSGTTAYVAKQEGRDYIGIELQKEYEQLIYDRIDDA